MKNKLLRIAELVDAKYAEAQKAQTGALEMQQDAIKEFEKTGDETARMKAGLGVNIVVTKTAEMAVYKELAAILRQVNEEQ